jgi:hypothetical protein
VTHEQTFVSRATADFGPPFFMALGFRAWGFSPTPFKV